MNTSLSSCITSHPSCIQPSTLRMYGLPKLIELERIKSPLCTKRDFFKPSGLIFSLVDVMYLEPSWASPILIQFIPIFRIGYVVGYWARRTSALNCTHLSQLLIFPSFSHPFPSLLFPSCCIMNNCFCLSISVRNCSSVGKNILYFAAKSCSFPLRIEYLAISLLVSEHNTMPMVGLSPSVRFSSSYIRTYISICPTS